MGIKEAFTYQILVTSDIHGHIHPTNYRTQDDQPSGLAKLATLIKREREQAPELLLLDNGDLIQGTPLTNYAITEAMEQVHPAITALNELYYDAAVFGNHEFNYGQRFLSKVVQDSSFPWLSASVLRQDTEEPAFGKPYIVKKLSNGIKAAVLGVTTHYVPHWENPAHLEGLVFQDALAAVKHWVARIRKEEKPDLLIVSYHGGFERDLATGEAAERLTGENQAYAMCTEVEGIDVLITGHQHRFLTDEINGVTIIQPGVNGQAVGRISVRFEQTNEEWAITGKQAELLRIDASVEADPAILQLTGELEEKTQAWLDQPIGHIVGDMTIQDPLTCRRADNSFIEFVNRVQMEAAGVEVSNTALLNNESEGFGETVTLRDVLVNFMYPNTLTVLRLNGQDIRDALEKTAAYFQVLEDGCLGVNPAYLEPKAQHYNYDMWEGIEYEINAARPIGERVVKLTRSGKPLRADDELEVVMNNYRAAGGGDYDMYQGKLVVREVPVDMADLVAAYFKKHGTVKAVCNDNWRVLID